MLRLPAHHYHHHFRHPLSQHQYAALPVGLPLARLLHGTGRAQQADKDDAPWMSSNRNKRRDSVPPPPPPSSAVSTPAEALPEAAATPGGDQVGEMTASKEAAAEALSPFQRVLQSAKGKGGDVGEVRQRRAGGGLPRHRGSGEWQQEQHRQQRRQRQQRQHVSPRSSAEWVGAAGSSTLLNDDDNGPREQGDSGGEPDGTAHAVSPSGRPEVRVDLSDGFVYTKDEFLEEYGSLDKWNTAAADSRDGSGSGMSGGDASSYQERYARRDVEVGYADVGDHGYRYEEEDYEYRYEMEGPTASAAKRAGSTDEQTYSRPTPVTRRREVEVRVDPRDGKTKSKADFVHEYAGYDEWDTAFDLHGNVDARKMLTAEIDKLSHFIETNSNSVWTLPLEAAEEAAETPEETAAVSETGEEGDGTEMPTPDGETRMDCITGQPHTKAEFEAAYGRLEEWDAAEPREADPVAANPVIEGAIAELSSEKGHNQIRALGKKMKRVFQNAEVKLTKGSRHATPKELLDFVGTVSTFSQAFGVGAHYFEPHVLRDAATDDANFQHAVAYIDFLRGLQKTVVQTMGVVSEALESGSILNVEHMEHTELRPLLVAYGHAKGKSATVTDATIAKTLAHGHLPLEQGANMLWALGVGGEVNLARQLFTAAGPLASRYAEEAASEDGRSSCTCLAKIIWSCGALGLQKQSVPFLDAMATLSDEQLDSFDIHHIADVAWACTKLRSAAGDDATIRPALAYFAKRLAPSITLGKSALGLPTSTPDLWVKNSCVATLASDKERLALSHALASLSLLGVTIAPEDVRELLKICGQYRPEPSPLRGESHGLMFDPARVRDMNMGAELAFHTKASGASSAISGRVREQEKKEFESYAVQAELEKETGVVNEWPEAGAKKKAGEGARRST